MASFTIAQQPQRDYQREALEKAYGKQKAEEIIAKVNKQPSTPSPTVISSGYTYNQGVLTSTKTGAGYSVAEEKAPAMAQQIESAKPKPPEKIVKPIAIPQGTPGREYGTKAGIMPEPTKPQPMMGPDTTREYQAKVAAIRHEELMMAPLKGAMLQAPGAFNTFYLPGEGQNLLSDIAYDIPYFSGYLGGAAISLTAQGKVTSFVASKLIPKAAATMNVVKYEGNLPMNVLKYEGNLPMNVVKYENNFPVTNAPFTFALPRMLSESYFSTNRPTNFPTNRLTNLPTNYPTNRPIAEAYPATIRMKPTITKSVIGYVQKKTDMTPMFSDKQILSISKAWEKNLGHEVGSVTPKEAKTINIAPSEGSTKTTLEIKPVNVKSGKSILSTISVTKTELKPIVQYEVKQTTKGPESKFPQLYQKKPEILEEEIQYYAAPSRTGTFTAPSFISAMSNLSIPKQSMGLGLSQAQGFSFKQAFSFKTMQEQGFNLKQVFGMGTSQAQGFSFKQASLTETMKGQDLGLKQEAGTFQGLKNIFRQPFKFKIPEFKSPKIGGELPLPSFPSGGMGPTQGKKRRKRRGIRFKAPKLFIEKELVSDLLSLNVSMFRFGKATHPKPTPSLWRKAERGLYLKVPTLELLRRRRK